MGENTEDKELDMNVELDRSEVRFLDYFYTTLVIGKEARQETKACYAWLNLYFLHFPSNNTDPKKKRTPDSALFNGRLLE